jgi:type II secretory pathway predicted ATPase ExeA
MWKCKKCGKENEDSFDSCWSCGVTQDGTESVKEDIAKSNSPLDYTSTSGTSRMIASLVSFLGWVIVAISVLILLFSLVGSLKENSGLALMGLFPSLAGIISGLLLVMSGQLTRALVDTADNTGQMLAIMKNKKGNETPLRRKMYNEFYGFSEKPFEITPDPKFLYLTSSHRKALDAMIKDIKSRQGFISITGEVGTGKTTLIHSLLTSLDDKVKTVFIFHTAITFEEFLGSILRELHLEVTGKDKKTLLYQLVEYLLHIGNDEMVAVIIDEAQHLAIETLQELGKLSDLGSLASWRLQIVFVGQPEFENILNSPNLKILNQRIRIRREITTMTAEESRDYIEHRLKLVGSSTSKTFTPKAISVIIEHAEGIPRIINIVCDNALLNGFSESKKIIDEKIIREVIKNLEGPSRWEFRPMRIFRFVKRTHPIRRERILSSRLLLTAVILLFLLGLGGIVSLMFGFLRYGPSNQRSIESMWTSLFHTERPLVAASQTTNTKTSKVDVRYPPVESPQPDAPPSASSIRISNETRMESIIVKKGQDIKSLAEQYYGRSNITIADFILDSNPEITDVHLISVNQKIRMPKITEGNLIVQSSDRTYKINVGTFWSPKFAKLYRSEPSLRGKEIEIVARKATPEDTWYRVVVGKFDSEDEALKVISILKDRKMLPLFTADLKLH